MNKDNKQDFGNCSICDKPFKDGDLQFKDFGNSFYYCAACRNKRILG